MNGVERIFLDTNVLVYAHDRNEAVKGPAARTLLTRILLLGQPVLSTQVLSEFYWAATRKLALPLTHAEASAEIRRFVILARVVANTWQVLEKALLNAAAHGFALWDAQIHAAAAIAGAATVLSEDFQDGRTIEGVTFLNPFASGFDLSKLIP